MTISQSQCSLCLYKLLVHVIWFIVENFSYRVFVSWFNEKRIWIPEIIYHQACSSMAKAQMCINCAYFF